MRPQNDVGLVTVLWYMGTARALVAGSGVWLRQHQCAKFVAKNDHDIPSMELQRLELVHPFFLSCRAHLERNVFWRCVQSATSKFEVENKTQ